MPQSLVHNLIHLVFSTKHRTPCPVKSIRHEVHAYLAAILRNWDSPAVVINGVEDHVHLLFSLAKTVALCKVVEEAKTGSSKWIKTKGVAFSEFHWQNGYGAFSVSQSNKPAVWRYIDEQETHHQRVTYQDEFRGLCRKHGVEFDERYVWD